MPASFLHQVQSVACLPGLAADIADWHAIPSATAVGDRPPGAGHCWPRFGRLRPRAEAGDQRDGVAGPQWWGTRQTGVAGV